MKRKQLHDKREQSRVGAIGKVPRRSDRRASEEVGVVTQLNIREVVAQFHALRCGVHNLDKNNASDHEPMKCPTKMARNQF